MENPLTDQFTPLDARHKEQAYNGLARHYVESGDAWFALHAQNVADVCVAVALLSENGFEPFHFLESLADGIAADIDGPTPPVTAVQVLDRARTLIAHALPFEVVDQWSDAVTDLPGLELLPRANPAAAALLTQSRLGESGTVEHFIEAKHSIAHAGYIEATEYLQRGDHENAVAVTYIADLAAFEAWVFSRSIEVGDLSFVQAEMRWSLAVAALAGVGELPLDAEDAVALLRSRLAWALGPREAKGFAMTLHAFS